MPSTDSDRIAVLIDADNTSPQHAGPLLQEIAKYGVATVKRAYGDWTGTQLNGWKGKLNENAIQPMQQFAYTTGKNSTDSALIIDAMDLLYSGHVDGFALVSSDSDFTRLATRLRESGKTVIGLGLRKTPQSLVKACDRFVYLELLSGTAGGASQAGARGADDTDDAAGDAVDLPDLRTLLTDAVNSTSHDDGWASLSSVANHVNRSNPSFDVRAYGESKLVNLARAQAWLDVEQPESGSVRVRLSATAPATRSTRTRRPAADKTDKTDKQDKTDQVADAGTEPIEEPTPSKPATKRTSARKSTARARKAAEPVEPVEPPEADQPVEPVVESPEPPAPPKVTVTTRTRRTAKKAQPAETEPAGQGG